MEMMKPAELVQKFEESSVREQALIGLTGAVAVVFLLQLFVLDPIMAESEKVKRRVLSLSNTQISLQKKLSNEPSEKSELARKQKELVVQQQKVEELDRRLAELSSSLVSPDVMPELLQSLVSQNNMELVVFENLAPKPLMAPELGETAGAAAVSEGASQVGKPLQLFRHGMSLQLRGSFISSLKYLRSVESQPWRFMWDSLNYEVEDYPNGNLTIRIETLSADQHWLGV